MNPDLDLSRSDTSNGKTVSAPQAFEVGPRYRWYVVWLLFVVYVLNFVDRQVLLILMEPIRLEFKLTDGQLGLLGGLAFAIFYSFLGLPIARLADRRSRVNIMAISIFVWSLATALTGFTRSFTQLLLARVAVGVGEAGCSPPAYSLLSDYFTEDKRTTAFSIYSMGIYGGVFVGLLTGALVAEDYGWRAAFLVVGLPGLLLSIIVKLTLREPPRGYSDGRPVSAEPPPISAVLGNLARKSTFRHLALGASLNAFVAYGVTGFHPSFLIRVHAMSIKDAGVILSVVAAVAGIGGVWMGGYLADKLSNRRGNSRWQLWVPALATSINVPIAVAAYQVADPKSAIALLFVSLIFGVMYLGPSFATMQRLVSARERALGIALLLLIINLIGLGLGPWLVGLVSDLMNQYYLNGGHDVAEARALGLRASLSIMMCISFWCSIHYVLAARTLQRDSFRG